MMISNLCQAHLFQQRRQLHRKPVSREAFDIEVVTMYPFDEGAPTCLYAIAPCLVHRLPSGNICPDHLLAQRRHLNICSLKEGGTLNLSVGVSDHQADSTEHPVFCPAQRRDDPHSILSVRWLLIDPTIERHNCV